MRLAQKSKHARWPLWVAVFLCLYSWLLLFSLYRSQEDQRSATNSRVVADSQRRAIALGDFMAGRKSLAAELAELPEVRNFLANRALGMSVKYGLGANLDAIERRFHSVHAKRSASSGGLHQFVFIDKSGGVLASYPPGDGMLHSGMPPQHEASIRLDEAAGKIVVAAPVTDSAGEIAGTMVAVEDLSHLSKFLISTEGAAPYREFLLKASGQLLAIPGWQPKLGADEVRNLAAIGDGVVTFVGELAADRSSAAAAASAGQSYAVRSVVPGYPYFLVTVLSEGSIYGRLTSVTSLYLAGIVPLLLLFGLFYYEDIRKSAGELARKTVQLQFESSQLQDLNRMLSGEIEHRKLAESELLAKTAELEVMARNLERSKREADQANNAKSAFLANMSHEIRTPLNAVLGMAQLLKMNGLDERDRAVYASTIYSSGQGLLQILNDILDISKIESGKLALSPVPFSPSTLLSQVELTFHEQAAEKGLSLQFSWAGSDNATYVGDVLRIRQVLNNLVSNAIKFTEAGSVTVAGRVIPSGNGGLAAEVAVTDTGIGIPKDKQGLLFRPFAQIDNSMTRLFGGTGLGLSIVRTLVTLMGGTVALESREQGGTTILVRIPLKENAAGPVDAAASWQAPGKPVPMRAGRSLIVEDVAANRLVLDGFLRKLGLSCETAENGEQAVRRLTEGGPFDLVFMDCQMPVMDGFTATELIREREKLGGGHIPIIALTAGAYPEDKKRCIDAGMDDFVAKPIHFDEVCTVVDRWL